MAVVCIAVYFGSTRDNPYFCTTSRDEASHLNPRLVLPVHLLLGDGLVNKLIRVEAGSNTSTVTLRVVGGDEKENLKSETVKYGRESQVTLTRERLRWHKKKKQDRNCRTVINIWS
jgi:hypothetical protein